MNTKFWNWKVSNEEKPDEERVLEFYGVVADEPWIDDSITPQMFKDELMKGSGPVTVWINSPGGDCVAASQIYSMLMDYPGDVTVKIDGIAASAASVIAMAGTKVLMAPTALMMIHNPATSAFGDHNDFTKAIEMLDEVKESIINAYERKTNLPRDDISKLMENETWMNAKKAVELGFADRIIGDEAPEAKVDDAFSFSARAGERRLMERIVARVREEEKTDVSEGTKITELEKRLELIK